MQAVSLFFCLTMFWIVFLIARTRPSVNICIHHCEIMTNYNNLLRFNNVLSETKSSNKQKKRDYFGSLNQRR